MKPNYDFTTLGHSKVVNWVDFLTKHLVESNAFG